MNRIIIIFLLSVIGLWCKNNTGHSDFKSILRELCSENKDIKSGELYTSGTLGAMNRAVKAGIVKKPGVFLQNYFSPEIKLKVIKSSINGSDALVKVKYIRHPVENVIGSEVNYRFHFQEGRWKLDFQKELDEVIVSSRSGVGKAYLKNKSSKY